jgi:hypothetical protein
MHDVFREIVIAAGDKNFRAGNFVSVVTLRYCACRHDAEIRAGVRFGHAHRARPFAAVHFGQPGFFQCFAGVRVNG